MSSDYSYKQDIDNNSSAKLEITVKDEYFQKAKENAYKTLAPQVSLKGFRPGMAPRNLIEAQLGPKLIEQALNRVLPKITAEIINELKLEPITQVEYKVDKLEMGKDIEYTASFTVLPKIKLADPKKIKVTRESAEVKDEDVEQVLKNMFEDTQKHDHDHEGHDHHDHEGHEHHDHEGHDHPHHEEDSKKAPKTKEESDAKIDDKWVETLKLENIKTLDALKVEIKKTLETQRKTVAEEKYDLDLLGELVKSSGVKVPESLVKIELDAREQNYVNRITSLGLKIEDFLRNQNTTIEKLRDSWKEDSEKKLAVELVLLQIAKDNDFTVSDEEVEKEIASISDPNMRADYDSPSGKAHVRSILGRQKSIEWLRSQVK